MQKNIQKNILGCNKHKQLKIFKIKLLYLKIIDYDL